jgi:hypothetical protein
MENEITLLSKLLTDGTSLQDRSNEIAEKLIRAYNEPESYLQENDALWVNEAADDGAMDFAIMNELGDLLLMSDKIDELHEQITDIEEPFPYDANFNTWQYFTWLDEKLAAHNPSLSCLEIGNTYGDSLQMITVFREDADEIIKLCSDLGITCMHTKDMGSRYQ